MQVEIQTSEMVRWTEQEESIIDYFMSENAMIVQDFQNLLRLVPFREREIFLHLKRLTIQDCGSLVEVFESEVELDVHNAITHNYELEAMLLRHLPNLMHVWKTNFVFQSFGKLTTLEVEYCFCLKNLLSPSMARSLLQLQFLRVCGCDMIEEIVANEAQENEGDNDVMILLPKLIKLELIGLLNLKCFCPGAYNFELPSCEEMVVERCPKLIKFSHGTVSTPKLQRVCKGLYQFVNMMEDLNVTIYNAHSDDFKVHMHSLTI